MPKTTSPKSAETEGKEPPSTVGFRLDPETMAVLGQLARAQGLSRHDLAKQWVLERLEHPLGPGGWEQAVESIHAHLEQVRKNLAVGFEAVVGATGKVTPAQAKEWADYNLRGKPHVVDQQSDQSRKLG